MAAYMKNTAAFVKQIHTVQHFLTEYIQPPLKRKGREFLTGFYIMFYFLEYPRASKAGSANHNSVHSILVKTLFGTLWRSYIPVSNDRYMHTGILFYFTY